jgi:hypothetical protein
MRAAAAGGYASSRNEIILLLTRSACPAVQTVADGLQAATGRRTFVIVDERPTGVTDDSLSVTGFSDGSVAPIVYVPESACLQTNCTNVNYFKPVCAWSKAMYVLGHPANIVDGLLGGATWDDAWIFEDDCRYGNLDTLRAYMDYLRDVHQDADLLATSCKTEAQDPAWSHWRYFRKYFTSGSPLKSFNAAMRLSRALANQCWQAIQANGKATFLEVFFINVCHSSGMRWKTMVLADIWNRWKLPPSLKKGAEAAPFGHPFKDLAHNAAWMSSAEAGMPSAIAGLSVAHIPVWDSADGHDAHSCASAYLQDLSGLALATKAHLPPTGASVVWKANYPLEPPWVSVGDHGADADIKAVAIPVATTPEDTAAALATLGPRLLHGAVIVFESMVVSDGKAPVPGPHWGPWQAYCEGATAGFSWAWLGRARNESSAAVQILCNPFRAAQRSDSSSQQQSREAGICTVVSVKTAPPPYVLSRVQKSPAGKKQTIRLYSNHSFRAARFPVVAGGFLKALLLR